VYVAGRSVVHDVDQRERRDPRRLAERLNGYKSRRDACSEERVDHDRVPAANGLRRDVVATLGVANPQAPSGAQAEMLTRQGQHVGVDFAHLLAPGGILRGQGPGEGTRAAADVKDAPGTRGSEHDAQPAHVVELEVRRVGEIDVGRLHAVVA
jgi:hypothetical protein